MTVYNNFGSEMLLPGVTGPDQVPPSRGVNARASIAAARRRCLLRDAADLAILLLIDALFFLWPAAKLPFVSRDGTLLVLLALHLLLAAVWFGTRWYPAWKAERIAASWSEEERRRFYMASARERVERRLRRTA
jgi:hypothetical protein